MIKSRRMKWAGYVARMGDRRGTFRVLLRRPEENRHRWEDNIKMGL
jgi:hypothetical protein